MKTEIVSGWNAGVSGVLRTFGFFALILVFMPTHLLVRLAFKQKELLVPRLFHVSLIKLMGFRVRVRGRMSKGHPTFFVSNHSSYLDIPVLGSIIPASFVAKTEVASWPLIGTMARMQGTVFIERRAVKAALQRGSLRESLENGRSLILFPEGTSSDGHRTLPFKSSLFSAVESRLPCGAPVSIQPVSIVCTRVGGLPMGHLWRPYYAWYGDMTFVKHLWNVFKIGSFTVDVVFHPPVTMDSFSSRKDLAEHCRGVIASGVNGAVTGRQKMEKA